MKLPPTAKDGLGSVTTWLSQVPHSRVRVVVVTELVITIAVAAATTENGVAEPFVADAVAIAAADAALAERGSLLPHLGLDAAWPY